MKRDMNELNLQKAFRPMPADCREALVAAARSVKEEEPVKRAVFRTVLITALVIVSLMAAAYAAVNSGLMNWFENECNVTLPANAQKLLEETDRKTYEVGPVTFTLEGLMADGQIAYLGASARMSDGSKALMYPSDADPQARIGEALAGRLGLPAETTWQEAAAQTGLPLYGLMAWLQPQGDVMGGEEMMAHTLQQDGSVLLVDMLYTDPAKVGESLKGEVTLWAYELDPVTFERKDEGWRVADPVELTVTGVREERTYEPAGPVRLAGGLTLQKVTAQKRAAGVYVNIHLKCRENTTLAQAWDNLQLTVLDGEGKPFPTGISFTSECLDEKGEKFPMDDPANLVIPGFIYRTMITVEELPHSLLITDGQVAKVQ